jgi:hypothetical protein
VVFCVFNKRLLKMQSHYQSMAISIDKARTILGEKSNKYSDEEIKRLLWKLEALARGCLAKIDGSKGISSGQLLRIGAECSGNG